MASSTCSKATFSPGISQPGTKKSKLPCAEILKRLDEYDPTTLTLLPEETRDLFKKLYHYLLPREIRHNLGEYYTPDWLAQRLLTQVDNEFFQGDPRRNETHMRRKLLSVRFLDPACGSGTFPILIIARMLELGQALLVQESELLESILRNVVGFDLNPLAVLTARVNYLLAIADLLEYRRGDITIPIYLADSVRTPTLGEELFSHDGL
jgi:SAM-dependent methyltransferase